MDEADGRLREAIEIYFARAEQMNRRINAREAVPAEMVKDTALAAALVLRAYCLPSNWCGGYGAMPVIPLPCQLADDIARHIQIICGGHVPQWVLHLQRRGSPQADSRIRELQGIAVAYVKLCKNGAIDEKAPTARVARTYGVRTRTVQYWIKSLAAEPSDFFSQAQSENERARLIAASMEQSGAKYRDWGLSPKNPRPFGKGRKRPRAKR